jgi:hypothetical protein
LIERDDSKFQQHEQVFADLLGGPTLGPTRDVPTDELVVVTELGVIRIVNPVTSVIIRHAWIPLEVPADSVQVISLEWSCP